MAGSETRLAELARELALRAGGDGMFGLTENRGGGSHLQSYALLASGDAAVKDVARLTGALRLNDLRPLGPRFAEPDAVDRYPLNPTHHLWRVLIDRFGFPFLKTELVRRNPGRLPGVDAWPALVDDPTRRLVDEHLGAI